MRVRPNWTGFVIIGDRVKGMTFRGLPPVITTRWTRMRDPFDAGWWFVDERDADCRRREVEKSGQLVLCHVRSVASHGRFAHLHRATARAAWARRKRLRNRWLIPDDGSQQRCFGHRCWL